MNWTQVAVDLDEFDVLFSQFFPARSTAINELACQGVTSNHTTPDVNRY